MTEIYGLYCPVTGHLRYIGKARISAKRLKTHLSDCRRRDHPVHRWLRKLISSGMRPDVRVLCVTWDWQSTERQMICQFRSMGDRLLNVADGGNEPHVTRETRVANGRHVARMVHDDPVRRRIWELKRSLGSALRNGFLSDRTKEILRGLAAKHPRTFPEWATL